MASAATITGIFLIIALIGLGIGQSLLSHWPGSGIAGAVVAPVPKGPTQQEINVCMNACMQRCVVNEGDEPGCLAVCDPQCGA